MEFLLEIDSLRKKHLFLVVMGYSMIMSIFIIVLAKSGVPAVLCVAIAAVPFLAVAIAISTNKNKASNNFTYRSNGEIALKRRGKENRFVLTLDRYEKSHYQYVPESATFTAVSVGGVTTGGWDVTPEHYESKYAGSTDKYLLHYEDSDQHSCFVNIIHLDDSAADMAKKDKRIAGFVEDNKIVLLHKNKKNNVQSAYNKYGKDSNYYEFMNNVQSDVVSAMLDEYEMTGILNFLCGE